jgi:hypothetical protein
MSTELDLSDGLTLQEVLDLKPELKLLPEFSIYPNSDLTMFEKITKYMEEETEYRIERHDKGFGKVVNFKIIDKKTDNVIAYCDMEADYTGCFKDDGCFKYPELTIPSEKEEYFYLDKPFFFIKYDSNFKYCYVLDGSAVKHKIDIKPIPREMGNEIVTRTLICFRSNTIFSKKYQYGIHRCNIQDWLKAVTFFLDKREKEKLTNLKNGTQTKLC